VRKETMVVFCKLLLRRQRRLLQAPK